DPELGEDMQTLQSLGLGELCERCEDGVEIGVESEDVGDARQAGCGGVHEGHDVWIHLGDDEMVHVEHLGESGHWQVVVDAPIDPADRCGVPGRVLACRWVLGEEVRGGEEKGHRARGSDGGPDQHIRAGDVI
ncbi:hypothetical protein V493_02367, partial [Pseudogymnoascus sp. VKM F-4281 (FW-2241)]